MSATFVCLFVVGSNKSAVCVHPWCNGEVVCCTFVNREYSIRCVVLLHDLIMNESNDSLPVVQSSGLGTLHTKQNAFILGYNRDVHARHNPCSSYSFIRQYFCSLALYVNPMVAQTSVVRISGCLSHN